MMSPDRLKTDVADRLRRAREALGLSSTDAAARLQLPLPTYSRYETEVSFPPPLVLRDLDRLFGISATYLITGRTGDLPATLAKRLTERPRQGVMCLTRRGKCVSSAQEPRKSADS